MNVVPEIKISKEKDDRLIVQRGKKKAALSYQEVFALGHSFFSAGQYALAWDVFSALAKNAERL